MPRVPSSPFVVVAVAALLAARADAHAGTQAGRAPFVVGGALVGGGTTWGLVLRDGDAYRRVCEEATGSPNVFEYWRRADGAVYAGVVGGLLRAVDDGCDWEARPGAFDGSNVSEIEAARDAPDVVWIATADYLGANGVHRSVDGAESFAGTGLVDVDAVLFGLVASPDGASAWVSGIAQPSGAPYLRRTDDEGANWDAPTADFSVYDAVEVLALDGTTLLLAATRQNDGVLLESNASLASIAEVGAFPNTIVAVALDGLYRYVLLFTGALYRKTIEDAEWTLVDGVDLDCLVKVPGEAGLWGCGQACGDGQFLRSDDGVVWTKVLGAEVVERACGVDSAGAQCAQFAPAPGAASCGVDAGVVAPPDDAGVDDAGSPDDDDDAGAAAPDGGDVADAPPVCACDAARADGAPLVALLLLALLRRRASSSA